MLVHAREIHAENIFAFAKFRDAENLFALERSIRLHFDAGELVIRVVEEETFRSDAPADIDRGDQRNEKREFGQENQRPAVAMLDRFARADFDIEEMLLLALTKSRETAIAHATSLLSPHRPPRSSLARESSMMRRQRSG